MLMNPVRRIVSNLNNHYFLNLTIKTFMNKFKLSLYFILLAPLFSFAALADDYPITESEARKLPPFCLGLSIGNFEIKAQALRQDIPVPGRDAPHFCHGMKSIIRGDRGDKKAYEDAVKEFEYVK